MTLVAKQDFNWCQSTAKTVISGRAVMPSGQYPGVERGLNNWRVGTGPPEEAVDASLSEDATSFVLRMPRALELKKLGTADRAKFDRFVESVIVHELTHRRQSLAGMKDTWPARCMTSPEKCLDTYYTNPLEMEAHAAQIAYDLVASGGANSVSPTEADVFASAVGKRIDAKICSLYTSNTRGQDARKFRADLVGKVQQYFGAFI